MLVCHETYLRQVFSVIHTSMGDFISCLDVPFFVNIGPEDKLGNEFYGMEFIVKLLSRSLVFRTTRIHEVCVNSQRY